VFILSRYLLLYGNDASLCTLLILEPRSRLGPRPFPSLSPSPCFVRFLRRELSSKPFSLSVTRRLLPVFREKHGRLELRRLLRPSVCAYSQALPLNAYFAAGITLFSDPFRCQGTWDLSGRSTFFSDALHLRWLLYYPTRVFFLELTTVIPQREEVK